MLYGCIWASIVMQCLTNEIRILKQMPAYCRSR